MAQSGCAGLPGILSVKSMGKQRKLGAMVAGDTAAKVLCPANERVEPKQVETWD